MLEVAMLALHVSNSVSAVKSLNRTQEIFSLEIFEFKAFHWLSLKTYISYGCLKVLYKLKIEAAVTITVPLESTVLLVCLPN